MSHTPIPTDASFEPRTQRLRWVYTSAGRGYRVIGSTRRTIVIDRDGEPVTLKRRKLQRTGLTTGPDGAVYATSVYRFDVDPQEIPA